MRMDITAKRYVQVREWASAKAYKKLSEKAMAFLRVLSDGNEMQRTDLFRAAGWEANRRATISDGGWTDFTDYRLFATGLLDMRATGVVNTDGDYNGVVTYWRINDKGLAAIK